METIINERYAVQRLLGEGGMGRVFLVEDLLAPRKKPLALKVFTHAQKNGEVLLAWFKREFKTLTTLRHPGLAQVFDFGRDRATADAFYTSEFVSGQNLYDAAQPLDLPAKLTLLQKVCEGLVYIHSHGILHNDLKPGNILVDQSTHQPKILDFGLSRALEEAVGKPSLSKSGFTGTAAYTAPELIRGEKPTLQSDFYALGMIFYKVLAGRLPQESKDLAEVLKMNLAGKFPSPCDFNKDLESGMEALIFHLLAFDPAERPRSAEEIIERLTVLSGKQIPATNDGRLLPLAESARFFGRAEQLKIVRTFIQEIIPHQSESEITTPFSVSSSDKTAPLEPLDKARSVVVLTGDAGMGKTAFLTHLKHHYQLADLPFVLVSAHQERTPLAALIRLLREIRGFAAKSGAAYRATEAFFQSLSSTEPGDETEESLQRTTLFFQISQILAAAFQEQPFVAAFDDAEALDEVSKGFLAQMETQWKEGNAFMPPILASFSDKKSAHKVFSHKKGLWLDLGPLTKHETEEFLAERVGPQKLSSGVLQHLHRHSGGSPHFLQEILRELITRGVLCRSRGAWDLDQITIERIAIPTALADLCFNRHARLPESHKALLAYIALWERPILNSDLSALMESDPQTCEADLLQLAFEDILQQERGEEWTFRQEIFADIVRKNLADRRRLHEKCALYLERTAPNAVEDLSRHYEEAGLVEKAAPYTLAAAQNAQRLFALQRAWELFQAAQVQAGAGTPISLLALKGMAEVAWRKGERDHALKLYERFLAAGAPVEFLEERIDAWKALGIASRDRGEYAQAIQYFEQGLQEASRKAPALRATLLGQIALATVRSGRYEVAVEIIERALSLVSRAEKFHSSAVPVLIIAGQIAKAGRRFSEARAHYQAAFELAEKKADLRSSAIALNNLAGVDFSEKRFAEALATFERTLDLARQMGDAIRICNGLYNLGGLEYFRGNYRKALDHLLECHLLAQNLQDEKTLISVETTLGSLEADRGSLRRAKEYLDRASERLKSLKDARIETTVLQTYAGWFLFLRQFSEAQDYLDRAVAIAPADLKTRLFLAKCQVALGQGDFVKAEETLEVAKEFFHGREDFDLEIMVLAAEAEVFHKKGDYENASLCLQRIGQLRAKVNNPLAWYHTRYLQLLTKFKRDADSKTLRREVEMLVEELSVYENPHLRWMVASLFGQILESAGETRRAIAAYQQSAQEFSQLAADMPEKWRKAYLDDPEKYTVLARQKELSHTKEYYEEEMENLREDNKSLWRVLEINFELTAGWKHREKLLEYILDTALELSKAHRGFIVLKKDAVLELAVARSLQHAGKWKPEKEFSRSVVQEVLATGKSQVLLDAGEDATFKEAKSVAALHLRSVACLPLLIGRKVIGALYLDQDQKRGVFSRRKVNLLQVIANQAALVLSQSETLIFVQQSADEISNSLRRAETIVRQQARSLEWKYSYSRIIGGRNRAMRELFELLDRVIPSDATVLIQGESGTGKDLIAQAIHYNGPRKDKPFISINCAALNAALLESELFGHVKGAFTGAVSDKDGLFVIAQGGTIFLDEIGDMPLELQAKLLRVLEEREVRALGSDKNIRIDIRFIAASNRVLTTLIEKKEFREDLYYRLNVVQIELPPLRERREDLDLLIDSFLKEFSGKQRRKRSMTRVARDALARYAWPGNVRELRHIVESMCTLTRRRILDFADLPEKIRQMQTHPLNIPDLETAKDEFYREYFQNLLQKTGGNFVEAAKIAGIYRESLHRLLKKYKLKAH